MPAPAPTRVSDASAPGATPAWTDQDLARDPHQVQDKARRVEAMFAAIAPSYDLNNRLHSLGRDQAWRRAAVAAATLKPGDHVLDVACGTGDLALAFAHALQRGRARRGWPAPVAGQVVGLDFTYPMLQIAARKSDRLAQADAAAGNVFRWINGDAMNLPLPDASVDVVSIAFGIRNVTDPAAAARQFHRVLRPGGRVIVLEFSLPRNALLRGLYNFYFRHIMPRTAALIARDRSGAYRYLPRSVNTFLGRQQMIDLLQQAGFREVTATPLTFGVAVVYRGVR
jgi:demethylmenaquinone methyltransferase/2-methoxy-6-polyprenyl-1,4-benzoquinol methylase